MTQEQHTTGRRKFQHLTKEKRAQIDILLWQGLPKTQIAKAVGLSRSACTSSSLEVQWSNRTANRVHIANIFGMRDSAYIGAPCGTY